MSLFFSQGSLKRQIILTFVVGFFLLATAFTVYQVNTESAYRYRESTDETSSLAKALAASSLPWLLANDVAGLLEVVHAFQSHPGLRYAMVISPSGQVLAHTDATKIGQFVSDEPSLALIKSPPVYRVMIDDKSMSDVAMPIMVNDRHVGWARAAQSREGIADDLHNMMLSSALFVLTAVVLSLFAALLIANRLGNRIGYLVRVAEKVQAGDYATRADIPGVDEISRLANSLNHMLDVLAHEEARLRESEALFQAVLKILPVGLWVADATGKLIFGNDKGKQIWAGEKFVGIEQYGEYKGWWLGSGKPLGPHDWAMARALEKGEISIEEEIEIECFDGTHKIIFNSALPLRSSDGSISGAIGINQDITERKKAEKEREQYFKFFYASTDLMGIADPNGSFKKINPAFLSTLGYAEADLLAKPFIEFVHPDDRQATLDEMARQIQLGFSLKFENRYLCKDGSFRWLSWNANFIKDEGITYATARDITESKRAEAVLRESEAALREAQRLAHLGSWYMDLATNQVFWSEVLYEMYGFDPALPPPLYTESMKLFTPESWERLSTAIAQTKETGFPYELELEMVKKEGGRGWMLARGELVRDAHGAAVRIRGVVMDITERKRAEEELRRSEQGLAEAQRMAHLGNWSLDIANNVLIWSDEIYRIFEIDPEKFRASYEVFLNAIHPEDRDMVNSAYTESVKNRKPYDIVHRLLMKDGRVKYVHERCETHYGEDGKPLHSVGTVHDITEQKVAEIALTALKDDLENRVMVRTTELASANQQLEAFSYSVSHDLRTPLRAIDGFSLMLLEDYADKLDDEGKRLLNVVRNNTSRMSQLIDDILRFSRAGRTEISFVEIDMERVVRDVLDELKPLIDEHKVQVNLGDLPQATGDRAMMHQVIENLLSNAIKFSGRIEGACIDIGGRIEGDKAIYYVKDNGVGFDMRYADKLFGVFQRLHGVDEFQGTGIGLAIVKRIITRQGGAVWAEGEVGKGATFYFSIPVPT